jgi:hypothetical protein
MTHLFPEASIYSAILPTGPLKVGGDWPGYFIRGDEALDLARKARIAAELVEDGPLAVRDFLNALADRLESCRDE